MYEFDFKFIEGQIGYDFKNRKLLWQAFVRRSYSEENGGENNEVLEFYGDRVLEFIVCKLFSERFGETKEESPSPNYPICIDIPIHSKKTNGEYLSDYDEGKLTEFRKLLVSKKSLADCIYDLDLERYLLLGESDEKNNARNKDSVKEDLFEAILGAIAIDSGWDIKELQNAVEVMLNTEQFISGDSCIKDITEWTIDKYGCVPEFNYFDRFHLTIPITSNTVIDKSIQHHPCTLPCYCKLTLGDFNGSFWAGGKTRGKAKLNACRLAHEHLDKTGLLFTIKDEIENPNEEMAINDLETLARRGYFELPEYEFIESHDENGNPIWDVTCSIDGFDNTNSRNSSKKKAKKEAAFKMLKYVLENYYEQED